MADATSKQSAVALSNMQSLAESKASQLDVKIRANQIKNKLRQLFKNVDVEKTSKVKEAVFFQICELHGVSLTKKDQTSLAKKFSNGGLIRYKEALGELQIDLVAAISDELRWVLT